MINEIDTVDGGGEVQAANANLSRSRAQSRSFQTRHRASIVFWLAPGSPRSVGLRFTYTGGLRRALAVLEQSPRTR